MILTGEELEYAISQYLDGHLSIESAARLEERLAVDAGARALLREYRELHASFNRLSPPPDVDFSRFSAEVLVACWPAGGRASAAADPDAHRWRIGFSAQSSRGIAWKRPLALAASLLVALTTAAVLVNHRHATVPTLTKVAGPQVEAATGPIIAEVSIGPAPSLASSERIAHEDLIDRPSIVLIDRADAPTPDTDSIY